MPPPLLPESKGFCKCELISTPPILPPVHFCTFPICAGIYTATYLSHWGYLVRSISLFILLHRGLIYQAMACVKYFSLFLLLFKKILHHGGPVRELGCGKMDMLSGKFVHSIFGAVVYEVVADIQILVMAQDKSLVGLFPKVLLHFMPASKNLSWYCHWLPV